MLLKPLRNNSARSQTSTTRQIMAPIRGLNARDDITAMKPGDAIVLDDLIPIDGGVQLRKGKTSHATGAGATIQSLMEYSPPGGTRKLFAATSSAIFDATSEGALGSAVVSSLNSGEWQHVNFATAGGNFLVLANGADAVRNYDGASWTTPSITGVTSADLISPQIHMERLWFVEKDSQRVWYLPAGSIAGAATSINFGPVSRLGGHLLAMASWSRDGGNGLDDLAVFITSEGEVHIYSGSDPASTSTWGRVGTFRIPRPIGRRCLIKTGADVGVLTTQGLVPLSTILSLTESAQARSAITDKVVNAFAAAASSASALAGWEAIEGPNDRLLVVNVPRTVGGGFEQFVMNTNNGRWCRYTGFSTARCWATLNGELYFGGTDGTVWRYRRNTDDGSAIVGRAIGSYETFGNTRTKHVRRIRPLLFGPSGYRPGVKLFFDYAQDLPNVAPNPFTSTGERWDAAIWDVAAWAPALGVNNWWQGINGQGFAIAVAMAFSSTQPLTYNGATVLFDVGDAL